MGDFAVKDIRYTVLHVPFHERCADAMQVYGPDWSIVELIEVETAGGVVGLGSPGLWKGVAPQRGDKKHKWTTKHSQWTKQQTTSNLGTKTNSHHSKPASYGQSASNSAGSHVKTLESIGTHKKTMI